MSDFGSVDEVLEFAMAREDESYEFYMDLAGRVKDRSIKELFESLAREEKGHRAKLEAVQSGKLMLSAENKIKDLKIADYTVDTKPSPDMGLQDSLLLAMKKEKAAFRLYTDLAASAPNDSLKETFSALAQEEARHKLRFETMYDDEVLTEN
ncbi:MAG: ferritin family protein [bacterium]